jgi:hypothetical protein
MTFADKLRQRVKVWPDPFRSELQRFIDLADQDGEGVAVRKLVADAKADVGATRWLVGDLMDPWAMGWRLADSEDSAILSAAIRANNRRADAAWNRIMARSREAAKQSPQS